MSGSPLRFSIALAFNPCEQWIPLARAAEAAGFDSVVVSDHLVYPGQLESAYPYTEDGQPRWDAQTAWPDPMIAIGAMAGPTERLARSPRSFMPGGRIPSARTSPSASAPPSRTPSHRIITARWETSA